MTLPHTHKCKTEDYILACVVVIFRFNLKLTPWDTLLDIKRSIASVTFVKKKPEVIWENQTATNLYMLSSKGIKKNMATASNFTFIWRGIEIMLRLSRVESVHETRCQCDGPADATLGKDQLLLESFISCN